MEVTEAVQRGVLDVFCRTTKDVAKRLEHDVLHISVLAAV
jgi:hypothetical protein